MKLFAFELKNVCRYDKSDLPALWPPVLYGDGSRAEDSKIVPMHAPPEKGPDNRTADQRAPPPPPLPPLVILAHCRGIAAVAPLQL